MKRTLLLKDCRLIVISRNEKNSMIINKYGISDDRLWACGRSIPTIIANAKATVLPYNRLKWFNLGLFRELTIMFVHNLYLNTLALPVSRNSSMRMNDESEN